MESSVYDVRPNTSQAFSKQKQETDKFDGCENCMRYHNPRHYPGEFISTLAFLFVSAGLAIMCIGYIVPRDYVFDTSLPARRMEAIEIHYANLSFYLDVCIIAGLGFVATGTLMVTVLILHAVNKGQFKLKDENRQDFQILKETNIPMTSYGSRDVK